MAPQTSAGVPAVFDCNFGEGGLDEFEPETAPPFDAVWRSVPSASAIAAPAEAHRPASRTRSWPFVVPVVAAAVILGAVLAWVGLRDSGPEPLAVVEPTPAAATEAAAPLVLPVAALTRTSSLATPVRRESAPQAVPPEPASLDPGIERTLAAVSESYRARDAASLTAVWPGADTAALAETFASLKYQALVFDRCRVRPDGAGRAVASCDVSITAAPKDGDAELQRHRESWTLALGRSGDGWTIAGVTVR